MRVLLGTPGEVLFAVQPRSTFRQQLGGHHLCSVDIFFQKEVLKYSQRKRQSILRSLRQAESTLGHTTKHTCPATGA